jgi:hypothetical protein
VRPHWGAERRWEYAHEHRECEPNRRPRRAARFRLLPRIRTRGFNEVAPATRAKRVELPSAPNDPLAVVLNGAPIIRVSLLLVVTRSCRVVAVTMASSLHTYRDRPCSPSVHPQCINTRRRRTLRPLNLCRGSLWWLSGPMKRRSAEAVCRPPSTYLPARLAFGNWRSRRLPAPRRPCLLPYGDHTGRFEGHLRLPCFSIFASPLRVVPCDDTTTNAILLS